MIHYSDMSDFEIKDAKPEDVEDMRRIVKNAWLELYPNETYGITRGDIQSIDWHNPAKLDKHKAEILENQGNAHNFVIKNTDDEIVGFCKVLKSDVQGEIDAMYVLPELQGKGLGKRLMDRAFEWIGPNLDIVLKVVAYNDNAIGFYKRMGFEVTKNKVVYTGTQIPCGKEIPRIEMLRKATLVK
jgi:ribosomal protein S18 acetylase RimI-like enzyme